MHRCTALGSWHCRRGNGYRRFLTPLVMTLALGACATRHVAPVMQPMFHHDPDPRVLMIDNAVAMLGQPYRWGGAAPGGFDCSGLVSYAAAGAGIRLPRTARAQQDAGIEIRREHLQAGDLVFMHLRQKELHVGIALDNRRFIHAPSTGRRVRIDSIDAFPYSRAFIEARRIVPAR